MSTNIVRECNTRSCNPMKQYNTDHLRTTLATDYPQEHLGKYAFRLRTSEGKEFVVFLPTPQMVNAFAKRKWSISLPVAKVTLMLLGMPLKDVYYPIEFFVERVDSVTINKLVTDAHNEGETIHMYHDGVLYGLAYWSGENICNDSRMGMSACDIDDTHLEDDELDELFGNP